MDDDRIHIEHRLTQIEGGLSEGFDAVIKQLTQLNGKVAKHEEYINNAKLDARELKGFVEGRASLRKKDFAILGTIVSILSIGAPLTFNLLKDL